MSDVEEQSKVTCSAEDSENIRQYGKHFNVPLTDELVEAIDTFAKDPSFENQKEVKLQVSKWLLSSTHESFKDSLWDAPKKAAEDAVFNLQFDKDVKEHLVEEGSEGRESEESVSTDSDPA